MKHKMKNHWHCIDCGDVIKEYEWNPRLCVVCRDERWKKFKNETKRI